MLMLIVDNTIADTYACFEAFNTKCRALGQAHLPSSRNTSKEGGLLPLTGFNPKSRSVMSPLTWQLHYPRTPGGQVHPAGMPSAAGRIGQQHSSLPAHCGRKTHT
eukprot:scaffold257127_cov13-Tisochrysis_lutea.AAC.1